MSGLQIAAPPRMAEVKRLLDAADLPSSDLDEAMLAHFCAGRSEAGLVGIVGLQPFGRVGLLRSLVVQPEARGAGAGRALVAAAERRAAALGVEVLYLLTSTAESYFRRLGYVDSAREAAPAAIRQSREFNELCPGDAAFLCRRLASADDAGEK